MSASFGRRKAKVIGGGGDTSDDKNDDGNEPVVKRPGAKGKKRSSVKVSFGGGTSMTEDDAPTEVFVPKKGGLGRHALANSARKREQDEDRPTYSKAHLEELRHATPVLTSQKESQEIDVAAKFGTTLSTYGAGGSSLIPTDAEIQEKKARRARLAAEAKARSGREGSSSGSSGDEDGRRDDEPATDSDDEFKAQRDTIAFRPAGSGTSIKKNAAAPRLVRDDEDFMEGDEDAHYGSGGGTMALSRRAARAQQAATRQQMRAMIDAAQDAEHHEHSDSDSSHSERAAYDAAQTRRGLDRSSRGRHHKDDRDDDGSRIPRLAPLPTLPNIIERLQDRLLGVQAELAADTKRLEDVAKERADLDVQEAGVDQLLAEIQQRWRELVQTGKIPGTEAEQGRLLEAGDSSNNAPQVEDGQRFDTLAGGETNELDMGGV